MNLMDSWGLEVNNHLERLPNVEKELLWKFNEQWADLLLMAALDDTKRHNLRFVLFPIIPNHGGTVNYSKKERRFDFIEYAIKGYARRIGL